MPNTRVVMMRLCKTPKGWRRYPAVFAKNGRLKHNIVLEGGVEKEYPVGRYQLRYYEGRRPVYKDVGENPSEAIQARVRQVNLMLTKETAKAAGVRIEDDSPRRVTLQGEFTRFIEATESRGSKEAAEVYRTAVKGFLEVISKTYVDEIRSDDLLKYQRFLRDKEYSDRTIYNRHSNVLSFLRFCKLDTKKLAPRSPKFEKALPEMYKPEEMSRFFSSFKNEHLCLIYAIFLETGLREQELMYLEWSNVDLNRGVLRVRANAKWGFKVKDSEQRDVPIPADLLKKLREYRDKHPHARLVAGTKSDLPNTKLLRTLKRLVNKARLNCGHCRGCIEHKECSHWYLHKFRATYITRLLRSGLDLRTVMRLSGHSDMESVMRYLSPADNAEVRERLDEIKWRG
jgi:integrase